MSIRPLETLWVLCLDKAVAQAYGVNKAGVVLALDSEGRELARLTGKPSETPKFVDDALTRNVRLIVWSESLAEAKQRAQADRKPIVALVEDAGVAKAMESRNLKDLHGKFIWARIAPDKESQDLKDLEISKPGEIAVYDGRPLGSEVAARTDKEVRAFLSRFVEEKK